MFHRLMEISKEAFDSGHFDTAYHILAAALHYVKEKEDNISLSRLAETAIEQKEWIDLNAPEHRHSTQSSIQRGCRSVFHLLAQQAKVRSTMVARVKRSQKALV